MYSRDRENIECSNGGQVALSGKEPLPELIPCKCAVRVAIGRLREHVVPAQPCLKEVRKAHDNRPEVLLRIVSIQRDELTSGCVLTGHIPLILFESKVHKHKCVFTISHPEVDTTPKIERCSHVHWAKPDSTFVCVFPSGYNSANCLPHAEGLMEPSSIG